MDTNPQRPEESSDKTTEDEQSPEYFGSEHPGEPAPDEEELTYWGKESLIRFEVKGFEASKDGIKVDELRVSVSKKLLVIVAALTFPLLA